ncbi:MAG: hypothetical protein NTX02_07790 [Planctomycetia bacterium]|nr:hypothetical protein [Planctomycetia bacterium]
MWLMSLLAGVVAIALVSFGPLREQLQYATAKAAIADRDWPRAIKILERLQQKTGPTARQQFLLGCVHRRQGEFRDGETCFERAESLGWEKVEIRRQRLLTVAQAGDIKDVEQELIRLLDSGGDDLLAEEIYEAMAKGYLNSFRMPDADRCLKFWADWQKNNPVQHFLKGTLEERFERPAAALKEYTAAIAIAPDLFEPMARIAQLELDTALLQNASESFLRCRVMRPDDGDSAIGLAVCRSRTGQRQEAKSLFYESLSLELIPEKASVVFSELGQLVLEDGEAEKSVWLFAKSVELDPKNSRSRFGFAAALSRIGKTEEAKQEQLVGQHLGEQQRKLINITRQAIGEPENPQLRVEAGKILMEQGFGSEGVRWLETALQIEKGHQECRRLLADYYEGLGKIDRASEHRSWIKEQQITQ